MSPANALKLRRTAATAASCAALLLLASSCAKKAQEAPKMVIPVVTDAVVSRDFPVFAASFGSLTATSNVDIKAQITGKIMEAKFVEGQYVNAGDTLFTIEKDPFEAALKSAKGTLEQDKATHNFNLYMVEANKILANTSAMAKQTYEQYVHNAESSAGKIVSDSAAIDTAAINLSWCDIKAPCSGITGKRLVDPGNIVSAADNPALVNITAIDPIYADFTVPEKYYPKIRDLMAKGPLKVQAVPQGESASYEGVVSMIDNKIDGSNGTLSIRASIKNSERKLWPGQFITVKLIFDVLKDAVAVPADAVQSGAAGQYVFVMKDNKAMMVEITTGQSDENQAVVLKGDLKPGDRVIKVGTMLLSPGAAVMDAQIANAAFAKKMAEAMAAKMGKAAPGAAQGAAQQKDAKQQEPPAKPAEKAEKK